MSDAVLLVAGFAVATLGMAFLALSITAHWRQAFGDRPQRRVARIGLRAGGAVLLAAAFAACAAADPVSMAVLVWTMMLTAAALLVVFSFTLAARRGRSRP